MSRNDELADLRNLADTQQRGSLDLPDFIIGMYLIQSSMANPSLNLLATLPPGTYEAASGGRASPVVRQDTGGPSSPIKPQHTGPTSILQQQRTGQSLSAQATGTPPRHTPSTSASPSNFSPSRQSSVQAQQWDVTPDAKATSDRFFAQLDPQGRGVIEGDVAVPFMVQSQLEEGVLANIW